MLAFEFCNRIQMLAMSKKQHGGRRPGAGRPKGGRYGEPTRTIRVPESLLPALRQQLEHWPPEPAAEGEVQLLPRPAWPGQPLSLPLYGSRVAAGFPSPADDHLEDPLDLNRHLIRHPAATFLVRASGDSMLGAGIHPGDILVVDRALQPEPGRVVIAVVDGELTVKRLLRDGQGWVLQPENPDYAPIQIREGQELQIWGVVAHVIHSLAES